MESVAGAGVIYLFVVTQNQSLEPYKTQITQSDS